MPVRFLREALTPLKGNFGFWTFVVEQAVISIVASEYSVSFSQTQLSNPFLKSQTATRNLQTTLEGIRDWLKEYIVKHGQRHRLQRFS
jgi:hypothetical protein